MKRLHWLRALAFGALASAAVGCVRLAASSSQVGETTWQACLPLEAVTPVAADLPTSPGRFQVVLVATSGPRAGAEVAGVVHLEIYPANGVSGPVGLTGSGAGAEFPLFGWAAIALEAVGATAPGSIASRDPARPGVLGIAADAGTPPLLRFGSDANGGAPLRFDGGYFILELIESRSSRFSGRWRSAGEGRAEGYFCAVSMEG